MAQFARASKEASARRHALEEQGEHIPPFLIASITSRCNLHCEGCYSRCSHATADTEPVRQLSGAEWARIFEEADGLGVSFILLAGGEPMIRRDVLEAAGKIPGILFPVFTNGTCMDEAVFRLLDRCRNLVPVMSIEGGKQTTDARRGEGVYDLVTANMDELSRRGLIFGASVTVTTRNLAEVTSDAFLRQLSDRGCKAVFFVEFVPMDEGSEALAPGVNSAACGGSARRWCTSPSLETKRAPAAAWRRDAAFSTSTPTGAPSPAPSRPARTSTCGTCPCAARSGRPCSGRCGTAGSSTETTGAAAYCMKNGSRSKRCSAPERTKERKAET